MSASRSFHAHGFSIPGSNRLSERAMVCLVAALCFSTAAAHGVDCSGISSDGQVTVEVRINEPEPLSLVVAGPACPATVPVRGVASAVGLPPAFDVYVVIDSSGSTSLCSGADIDADGVVGQPLGQFGCTDPGDSIYQAEVLAVERLVAQLDLAQARIGIISFSDPSSTRVILELSDDAGRIQAAIDNLRSTFPFGATDFAGPQNLARAQLGVLGDPTRQWMVLFLSDGSPTYPTPPFDSTQAGDTQAARDAAQLLADRDIIEHTYAIGAGAAINTLKQMAIITGGRWFIVRDPADVVDLLPVSVLTGIDLLVVENVTIPQVATDLELGPLGDFDAEVPVIHGWNEILVTAQASRIGQVQVPCPVRFFFACGTGCDPSTQGFWHRQCLATGEIEPGTGRPEPPLLVEPFSEWQEIVDALLAPTGQSTCEALDADPASDPCERALKQYTAFLLNIVDGRLGAACTLDPDVMGPLLSSGGDPPTTVEEAMALLEELLFEGIAGDPTRCKEVNDLADAVNTGEAVGDPEGPGGPSLRLVVQPSTAPLQTSDGGDAADGGPGGRGWRNRSNGR